MDERQKLAVELLYRDDPACPWDRWASFKDAISTVIYVIGAFTVGALIHGLFPNGIGIIGELVIAGSATTFLLLTGRIVTNEVRCWYKEFAKVRYEMGEFNHLIFRRENQPHSPAQPSTAKKQRKGGRR